jgi:outer membrane lipoprotein-sorting protein
MSANPAARVRAGIRISLRFALPTLSVICLSGVAHAADTQAQTVLKKTRAVYENAKTYRATIKSVQSGKSKDGKTFSLTRTQQVKYKSPNFIRIQVAMVAAGAAAALNGASQIFGSDGKSMFQYSSQGNQYVKGPGRPTIPAFMPINPDPATAKMLPDATVQGKPAFMIEAQQPSQRGPVTIRVAVDKSNYSILRITDDKGQNPSEFTNQVFNGAIPSSDFAFVPPAGAKLVVPQQQPMPGAPGGTGAPPRQ